VMALVIRAQLFEPGEALVGTPEQYNQLFTMHGTITAHVRDTALCGLCECHYAAADRCS
jgi:heme/copper-type cytochrome/quinol oxidase subunit 1